MSAINQAREWLARAIITAGRKLAGLVCPHNYVRRDGGREMDGDCRDRDHRMDGGRYACALCETDTTDPPFMAVLTIAETIRKWIRKRFR